MDCKDFKNWLLSRDGGDAETTREARAHSKHCPACERLFVADEAVEQALAAGVQETRAPGGIAQRARALADERIESTTTRWPGWSWKGFAPALALGLMLVFVVWNPFANPLDSIEVIANYALANHTRTGMTMAFTTDDTPDPQAWFSKRLDFQVSVPDLYRRGFTFRGGRECTIGPKKAAYLYYDDNGRHVSVFVMPARQINIPLQAERRYRIEAPRHHVEMWKADEMVCILVKDRDTATTSAT